MTGQEVDEYVARALDEVSDNPASPVYQPKAIADMPSAARTLADYLGGMVVDATANLEWEPTFRRRRRPERRRCIAAVMSHPSAGDQGVIGTARYAMTTGSSRVVRRTFGTGLLKRNRPHDTIQSSGAITQLTDRLR